jgi:hypothetical protein
MSRLSSKMPMGINYVVNATTFPLLDEALQIAESVSARQLLLLPEVSGNTLALSRGLQTQLSDWARFNGHRIQLAISANSADILTVPQLRPGSGGARFAHIDASSVMKRCAFDNVGADLSRGQSIFDALDMLRLTSTH